MRKVSPPSDKRRADWTPAASRCVSPNRVRVPSVACRKEAHKGEGSGRDSDRNHDTKVISQEVHAVADLHIGKTNDCSVPT